MAQYETLPLYKLTYDFLLRMMHAVTHFPREYKYTLGEKIQTEVINLIVLIYKVNVTKDKVEFLKQMEEQVQLVFLLIRISHDMKLLPTEKYASIVEMIDNIASQTKGWLKSNEKLRESSNATA